MRTILRAWTGSLEAYVLEVSLGQRRGKWAAITRFVFFCMSKACRVLANLRRCLLRRSGRLP